MRRTPECGGPKARTPEHANTRPIIFAAILWLLAAAVATAGEAPDLEQQVHHIAAELRCPVCQNLSVADSPSPLAQEMRGLIREQLHQGKSREEIVAYFVSTYGEWVLLAPKATGFNLLVYVVPFLGGAAGIAGMAVAIRRWVRRRRDRPPAAPEVSARDRERLDQALKALEAEQEAGIPVWRPEGPLAELEAQRAALCAAIHELEFDHRAGSISREDYAEMRSRYEAEAVALLHRLDTLGVGAPSRRAPDPRPAAASVAGEPAARGRTVPAPAARAPSRRRLWMVAGTLALAAFGVGAGALLAVSIQPRPEGGGITGSPLTGTGPADPGGLARLLRSARTALEAGRLAEAATAYRAVLDSDPRNVEALLRLGNILERSGEFEPALQAYDRALAIDPRALEALWSKGNVLFQRADYAGALEAWQRLFEAARPGPDRDYVEQRMADARARLAASGPVPRPARRSP